MIEAARKLVSLGARAAVVTGGHLGGDPVDVLADGEAIERFVASRLSHDMRGTGCLLAASLAAALAGGATIRTAVVIARAFVRKRIGEARILAAMRVAF